MEKSLEIIKKLNHFSESLKLTQNCKFTMIKNIKKKKKQLSGFKKKKRNYDIESLSYLLKATHTESAQTGFKLRCLTANYTLLTTKDTASHKCMLQYSK